MQAREFSAFAVLCYAFLLQKASGQVPSSAIVPDVMTDCSVQTVLYTDEEFSSDMLFNTLMPVLAQPTDNPCVPAATELVGCASDGSLRVKQGCCSVDCSTRIQGLIDSAPECYRRFIQFFCTSAPNLVALQPPLFGAARRCVGLNPSCDLLSQPGDLLPSWWAARTKNSTTITVLPGTAGATTKGASTGSDTTNTTGTATGSGAAANKEGAEAGSLLPGTNTDSLIQHSPANASGTAVPAVASG